MLNRKQLTVLHVIAEMNPEKGGVGQAVRMLMFGLDMLGVSSETASLDAGDADFIAQEKTKVHATGPGKGPWCFNEKFACWLNTNIGRFDVVIVHGLWLYNGYAARKAWIQYKRKHESTGNRLPAPRLFVMPHGMLDPYFQKAVGRKLKAARNSLYWKLVEQKLVHAADGLLFTCTTEMELARQPFRPYRPKKEYVIGLGTEAPPSFVPQMTAAFKDSCPEIQQQPYLLFLSRIHEKKGVDLLIEAYTKMVEALPTLPKLVIAGPGLDSPYGQHIRRLVGEKRLESQVYFPGMLTGDAKWGAFYGCEAFILPSHQENFGIAVAEALACSKPVLISNQVNIWQEIKEASAGLVVEDTAVGCQQLLEQWVGMPETEKIEMSVNAKACYHQHFAVEPAAKRLLEAIGGNLDQ